MSCSSLSLLAIGIVIIVLMITPGPVDGLTCDQTTAAVNPCSDFLVSGTAQKPSAACCASVKTLVAKVTSPQVRKDLCVCMKELIHNFSIEVGKLRDAIPFYCKVSFPVPLDPNADCNKAIVF